MLKRGCLVVFLVMVVVPISVDIGLSITSNLFGPRLEDYCKKENFLKVYDKDIFEKRRQEVENVDAKVSEGWMVTVTNKKLSQYIYNSIEKETYTLSYENQSVAEIRKYRLNRESTFRIFGASGNLPDKPCDKAKEYYLEQLEIIQPFNDPRFAQPINLKRYL